MTRPTPQPPTADPLADRFRLDSVTAGIWVTLLVCAGALVYALWYSDSPNQDVLVALTVAAAVTGAAMWFLPWERIVRSRWREAAFLAWTFADLALIVALAALDGGADSPFALALFIPIVFSSLSYPLGAVMLVGVVALTSLVGLALASGDATGHTALFGVCLVSTVLMAAWQARNHDRWRGTLALASRTDPLTEALNRRGFEEAAAALLSDAVRDHRPGCLVLLDLDRFKAYNDARGHAAGDALLRHVVGAIRPILRPGDTVSRIGGDEFAVLLPGADEEAGRAIVRRIGQALGAEVPHSAGLACAPDDGTELDPLYRTADAELYAVKRGHRRVTA